MSLLLPDSSLKLITILALLSLLPLIVVVGTSFLKLTVVLSILRNALGIQQIPPNIALYGLALVMSLFIMGPTIFAVKAQWNPASISDESTWFGSYDSKAFGPYRRFLRQNTDEKSIRYFQNLIAKTWPEERYRQVGSDSFFVLLPAFTISQLGEAFRIGLLIYLPFLAIDLLISNILLAMGMMMLSPMTISLPFKLLIFILAGGWDLILSQLVHSFS